MQCCNPSFNPSWAAQEYTSVVNIARAPRIFNSWSKRNSQSQTPRNTRRKPLTIHSASIDWRQASSQLERGHQWIGSISGLFCRISIHTIHDDMSILPIGSLNANHMYLYLFPRTTNTFIESIWFKFRVVLVRHIQSINIQPVEDSATPEAAERSSQAPFISQVVHIETYIYNIYIYILWIHKPSQ